MRCECTTNSGSLRAVKPPPQSSILTTTSTPAFLVAVQSTKHRLDPFIFAVESLLRTIVRGQGILDLWSSGYWFISFLLGGFSGRDINLVLVSHSRTNDVFVSSAGQGARGLSHSCSD